MLRKTIAKDMPASSSLPGRGRRRGADREPVGIQAVDMALEIMDAIVRNGVAISLTALSRETAIQPSKLHRYLVSLTRNGLLAQAPLTGLYDLGPQARRLGLAALNRFDAMGHAHQAVAMLCAETGYTIALYVWTDLGPALLRIEPGAHPFPVMIKVGSALPLCTSATGRVFLAHLPEPLTRPFVEREKAEAQAHGPAALDWRAIEKELAAIRAQTIHWTPHAIIPGLAVVAPIFDPRGALVCAITALAPRGHASVKDRAHIVAVMERMAANLARDMFGEAVRPAAAKPQRTKTT